MQTMAEAMANIEAGFLYNNNDLVEQGALKLSDAIRRVEPPLEEVEEIILNIYIWIINHS
jgi:hypothetical protein